MSTMIGAFFNRLSHAEALQALTAASLERDDAASAFRFADRSCRIFQPRARDRLVRAEALRRMGLDDFALQDLATALEVDPTDPLINSAAMIWGPEAGRVDAASRVLGVEAAEPDHIAKAIDVLLSSGQAAYQLRVVDRNRIHGWVVWRGDAIPQVEIQLGPETTDVSLEPDRGHRFAALGSATDLALVATAAIREVRLISDGGRVVGKFHGAQDPLPRRDFIRDPSRPELSAPNHVQAIVPVYADLEATRACLDSLERQTADIEIRTYIVDDWQSGTGAERPP